MSLMSSVLAAIETAMSAAGDFVLLGTYQVVPKGQSSSDYDPTTDAPAALPSPIANVRMIRSRRDDTETTASMATTDEEIFLIPAVDLPGIRPAQPDRLTYNGVLYNVGQIRALPGDVMYKITARRR